jgi:hypothetical protein
MPAPTPYRLYDADHGHVIDTEWLADELAARATATQLVEAGEYISIEIQHLEDGLHGYEYYRVGMIESEIEW